MLPFTELPQSVIDELSLYVKIQTPNILEYAFSDIEQTNTEYNTHLIWHDSDAWFVAHDIHVFQSGDRNKFEWCYYSAQHILNLQDAVKQLKYLKSRYINEYKAYKELKQTKRLSNLKEDF